MEEIYSKNTLERFGKVVRGLCFDLGVEYDFECHGSGLSLWYKGVLFFICCRHSFHDGKVVGPKFYPYDSLCFLTADGIRLEHPQWTRVHFFAKSNGEEIHHAEDLIIYEVHPTDCETYRSMSQNACVLDCVAAADALSMYRGKLYVVGLPNIHGGNIDDVRHRVKKVVVGRYASIKKMDETDITCVMDTSGLTDDPKEIGAYGINGMSGGAALVLGASGTPLLVGMLTSGTAASKRIVLMSAGYITLVLDNWLEQRNSIADSGEA